jgi:hypothetical protein
MSYTTINLTNPDRNENPIDGDYIQYNRADGSIRKKYYHEPYVQTAEELNAEKIIASRAWRDGELATTDYILPLTDHPDHATTLAYRALLRDWPSTSDFPDTKPTI